LISMCLVPPTRYAAHKQNPFLGNIIKWVLFGSLERTNDGTIYTMLEDQQPAAEPEIVSEQNPVASKSYVVHYIALGLFLVFLVGFGTWFGLQYLKSTPTQVQQDNTSETVVTQFDFTEAETQSAKDEVLSELRADFGFKEFI